MQVSGVVNTVKIEPERGVTTVDKIRSGVRQAALIVALSVGVAAAQVEAALIAPTNFDTLNLLPGELYSPTLLTDIMTIDMTAQGGSASIDIGDLESRVYLRNGTYIYEHQVTPQTLNPKEFNTGFGVTGFNRNALLGPVMRAGWSYSDAIAAGVVGSPSSAFSIILEGDGTIDWNVKTTQLLAGFWASGAKQVPISFFFESTVAPGQNRYNMLNSHVGFADSYAPTPVPEPASLVLLGSGLVGMWVARRRRQAGGPDAS